MAALIDSHQYKDTEDSYGNADHEGTRSVVERGKAASMPKAANPVSRSDMEL